MTAKSRSPAAGDAARGARGDYVSAKRVPPNKSVRRPQASDDTHTQASAAQLAALTAVWFASPSIVRVQFFAEIVPSLYLAPASPVVAAARRRGASESVLPNNPAAGSEVESNYIDAFLAACVVAKPGGRVPSKAMHALFCAWQRSNGLPDCSLRRLSRALRLRGYRIIKSSTMMWLDLRLGRAVKDLDAVSRSLAKSLAVRRDRGKNG